MEIAFLIGRILFGGYFLMNAVNHFTKREMIAGYAASKGIPSANLAVVITGILLLVGGLGIILGVYIPWAVGAIVVFLIPVSFKMHAFWNIADPMAKMGDMVNFTKNMALLGASLMLLAIPTPWAFSAF